MRFIIRNFFHLILFTLITFSTIRAQTGMGAAGGGSYPGFSASAEQNNQFKVGYGYSLFLRHAVIGLSEHTKLHARYSADFFYNTIDLPSENNVKYTFTDFAAGLFVVFNRHTPYNFYGGLSISYVSSKTESRYFSFGSQEFLPKIFGGFEYQIAEYYNLFSEIFFQFGEIAAAEEPLPVNGMGIMIGATMFFSTE